MQYTTSHTTAVQSPSHNQQAKVIWEEWITTPMSENAHSHCVCNMERYEMLQKRYGIIAVHYGMLLSIYTEPLRNIVGC